MQLVLLVYSVIILYFIYKNKSYKYNLAEAKRIKTLL